jgi:hypothetical protein
VFARIDVALLARLHQPVLRDQGFRPRLLQRLRGDELLAREVRRARELLARQFGVGLGGPEFALRLRTALGHADGGALDIGAQGGQRLAGAHGVTALDVDLLDHAHDGAAQVRDAERLDQAAQGLLRHRRRCGLHAWSEQDGDSEKPTTHPLHHDPQRLKFRLAFFVLCKRGESCTLLTARPALEGLGRPKARPGEQAVAPRSHQQHLPRLRQSPLQQRKVQRHQRLAASGLALAARAPQELAVDARRGVELAQHHVQPAGRQHRRRQADVRARGPPCWWPR